MAIRNEPFSVYFEAFDSDGDPLVDSANDITANLYKDDSGSGESLGNPTHVEANVYRYGLTAAQMDADSIAVIQDVANDGRAQKIFILTERGKTQTLLDRSPQLFIADEITSVTSSSVFEGTNDLSDSDNFYNDTLLVFTSGGLKGLSRPVSNYTGSSREFTVDPGFPASPSIGDKFVVIGRFA